MDARGQFLEDIESGGSFHDTVAVIHQEDLHTVSNKLSGNVRIRVELFGIQISVGGHFDLGIVTGRQSPCQGLPGTVTAIRAAVHFNEAGPRVGNDDLSVARSVLDAQNVESLSNVGNDQFCFGRIGFDRDTTKIDKGAAISFSLVVHPHHHGLVNTIQTHVIDDVFFSAKEFLAQYLPAISPIDQLTVHQLVKMRLCFVKVGTELDSIGTSRFRWFENNRILLGSKKFFHVLEFVASGLSHGPHSGISQKLLLDFLVPAVEDITVGIPKGSVREQAHGLAEFIGGVDTGFAAREAGNDLEIGSRSLVVDFVDCGL
mmetsp:Transcript_3317/g.7875  ORF Transcript_3317/g.7875 Transcript_3317/m.7875 type:complete len:316 (-) Transcript_3317:302-1249(-)